MIPHKNYHPAPGEVLALDKHGNVDPHWTWDGSYWRHDGKVHKPHHNTQLVGKPGTHHAGWLYDWHTHSWLEPDQPLQSVPLGGAGLASVPPHQQQPVVVHNHKEDSQMMCHPTHQQNLLDGLKNHWAVPLAGLAVLVISDFLTAPQPPQIPPGLDEPTQKFWMMRYAQNVAAYQERRQKLDKWGGVILGLGTANAAVGANASTLQQHMAPHLNRAAM